MNRNTSNAALHGLMQRISHLLNCASAETRTACVTAEKRSAAERSSTHHQLTQRLDRSRIPAHPAIS